MDLFSTLRRFGDLSGRSQIENYTTESLCFIWNYSLDKKTELSIMLLNYFNISVSSASNVELITQRMYKVDKKIKVIPDITIVADGQTHLIEVKVDSPFNKYRVKGKKIDQIDLYKMIGNVEVYSLTKTARKDSFPTERSKHWYGIYSILTEYKSHDLVESFLIENYREFLKENRMNTEKVTKTIEGLVDVGNLIDQGLKALKKAIEESKMAKIKYFFEPENESIGFYFSYHGQKCYLCLFYGKPEEVHFSFNEDERQFFIKLDEKYFSLSSDNQVNYIVDKFNEEYRY